MTSKATELRENIRDHAKDVSVQRSWPSLRRLLLRAVVPPMPAHQNRNSVLPLSLVFYALFILATVLVWQFMKYWDDDIIRAVRIFIGEWPWVVSLFGVITTLGSSFWILISTAIVGLTISVLRWNSRGTGEIRRMAGWYGDINFIFFTVLASSILVSLIKNTIGRARPKLLDQLGPMYFDFGAFESSYASFPSGHSATFGAFCMGLVLLFPRYKWWLFAVALIGGGSRVMVLAHYPSDVLVGLAFGAGITLVCARYLARRDALFRFRDSWLPARKR